MLISLISYIAPNWSIQRKEIFEHTDNQRVCLPVCLLVCLLQALRLKHNMFGQRRPQIKMPRTGKCKDRKWWVWTTRVAQVVRSRVPDQCFKSCNVEQQNVSVCLHDCLYVFLSACPTIALLKHDLFIMSI